LIVKRESNNLPCRILYTRRPELDTASQKLEFLSSTKLNQLDFEHIIPDKKHNWIEQSDNDFNDLIAVVDKNTKLSNDKINELAIFKLYTNGIKSNRDEWVYDFNSQQLESKISYFIDVYNSDVFKYAEMSLSSNVNIDEMVNLNIKWSRDLKKHLIARHSITFDRAKIIFSLFRPFIGQSFYSDFILNDVLTNYHAELFGKGFDYSNSVIYFSGVPSSKPFQVLISNCPVDYHFIGDTLCLPLYRYDKEGNRIDNITDWGLQQFQKHYNDKTITKLHIFHYTYAVLHYPEYRSKYELNLKREFPRLPFYDNFSQWVEWGSKLMELHINYETVAPYPLTRIDTNNNLKPKTKLKADREKNSIHLDDVTFLQDIPKIAWEYKLGNRSALEWILDQYKEKKPKDQTIAERFNNYRFADYKETVIDLLQRVCTVSVETMKIIEAMRH
jgi:predicted helicase